MINDVYFDLSYRLKQHYFKLDTLENTDNVILFLKEVVLYLESEDECYNRYFIQSNPLVFKSQNIEFMSNFNIRIGKFLDKTYKLVKKNEISKKGEIAYYLGIAYEYGLFNKPKEHSMAFHYYKISTELKNKFGTLKLATYYAKGLGTAKNYKKAIHFLKSAAKLGLVKGMHIYGNILLKRFQNIKKYVNGKRFLKLAVENANIKYPYSLYSLAKLCEANDEEIEKDKLFENNDNQKEIEEYYKNITLETDKSSEDNDNEIKKKKSDKNIDYKIKIDKNYALKLYYKGANLGDSNCIYRLAKAYETGDILKKINLKKSYEFYKLAAEMGHISAQLKISELYYQGKFKKHSKPEFSKALQWAIFAATKGNAQASCTVGDYILNGCGIKKNKLLALWWYKISSIYGYNKVDVKLKKLNNWINEKDKGHIKKNKHVNENECCCLF